MNSINAVMGSDKIAASAASNASTYHNVSALQQLKAANTPAAIEEIGRQFESMLAHQMLKAMRDAGDVFSEDSLFNTERVKFYRQMLDDQLSVELSRGNGLGLAATFAADVNKQYEKPDNNGGEKILNQQSLWDNLKQSGHLQAANKSVQSQHSFAHVASDAGINTSNEKGFASPEEFVITLTPMANKAAKKLGVSPEILLAQAALETGWGKNIIRHDDGSNSFNLFGIKADARWNGNHATVRTTEYFSDVPIKVQADFRSYDSYAQSFDDYVDFIQNNPRYLSARTSPDQYATELQLAGYATDPQYAEKIARVSQSIYQQQAEVEALVSRAQQ